MTKIEARLTLLERHHEGSRTIRTFQQLLDSPEYFHEITAGADGLRLFTQKDLDGLGEDFMVVKIIYDS
jgi:hypothetical protein